MNLRLDWRSELIISRVLWENKIWVQLHVFARIQEEKYDFSMEILLRIRKLEGDQVTYDN
jgi:hypothetical protein